MEKGTILLAAGGTGGHLFPAQALAHELVSRGWQVHLATDDRVERFSGDFPAEAIHRIPSATLGGRNPIALAKAFWSILDRRADFTAVIAANDLIAIGCYDVLSDTGRSIGKDVSVVGYNDMPFADKLSPPLTTVQIPHYQIGVRAADLMLELLEGDEGSRPVSIKLTPTLAMRGSTGPVPVSP